MTGERWGVEILFKIIKPAPEGVAGFLRFGSRDKSGLSRKSAEKVKGMAESQQRRTDDTDLYGSRRIKTKTFGFTGIDMHTIRRYHVRKGDTQ